MSAEISRIERGIRGLDVSYLIHSEYSKEALIVSAQELRDIYDWCLLHMREIEQEAKKESENTR